LRRAHAVFVSRIAEFQNTNKKNGRCREEEKDEDDEASPSGRPPETEEPRCVPSVARYSVSVLRILLEPALFPFVL
jgi:hypothetical protein